MKHLQLFEEFDSEITLIRAQQEADKLVISMIENIGKIHVVKKNIEKENISLSSNNMMYNNVEIIFFFETEKYFMKEKHLYRNAVYGEKKPYYTIESVGLKREFYLKRNEELFKILDKLPVQEEYFGEFDMY